MGQRVSSCIHPRFTCSNFVYANYGDYEKLKSEPDDSYHIQKHSQDCEKLNSQVKDSFNLQIHPQELHFRFELRKQLSCTLQLSNKSDNYVAFKVKTTNPKKYCVRPNIGVVLPRSICDITVTMQAQKETPLGMKCKDKFLIQTAKDITSKMFYKDSGYEVEEYKMGVVYVGRPQPQSSQASMFPDEARALISKLTEERDSVIEQNKRLQQELNLLKRPGGRRRLSCTVDMYEE